MSNFHTKSDFIIYVHSGEKYISTELTTLLFNKAYIVSSPRYSPLTQSMDLSIREMKILPLIADGPTSAQALERLFISKLNKISLW